MSNKILYRRPKATQVTLEEGGVGFNFLRLENEGVGYTWYEATAEGWIAFDEAQSEKLEAEFLKEQQH